MGHILLVDDREEDLELTRIALFRRPKLRCHLHVARDGREAYHFLTGARPQIDLILLDINMPDVNGFELLEQIQENATLRHTTIVMCSGSDYEPDRKRALHLGAIGYLLKPPHFAQLKEIIDRLPSLTLRQDGPALCLIRNNFVTKLGL
jgi:CheY-like chemotaxis protein